MYYGLRADGFEDVSSEGHGYSDDGDCSVAIDGGKMDDMGTDCAECGQYIEDDAAEVLTCDDCERTLDAKELGTCLECYGDSSARVEGHEDDCDTPYWRPEVTIGRYFNAAGVEVDEERGRVQLWVSVGDPRGAFVMNLELIGGELRLSVPTPDDSLLHCSLKQLGSPGYYQVGG